MQNSRIRTMFALGISIAVLAVLTVPGRSVAAGYTFDRPFGDAKVLATVPTPPGYPEGIAVRGNRVYVAGPATFGTTGNGQPSKVFAFDATTGALVQTFATQGEDFNQEHANSCIAFDGQGRLYVLNIQIGMFRIDLGSGQQQSYTPPFPNLPPCAASLPGTPCSPTAVDLPALPNDLAFDEAGNAYVTDSLQATIWRVPAGGGVPQVWFQDQRLASGYIGVNGIRLSPDRTKVLITVTTDLLGQSFVYTLPLVAHPTAADLQVFHQFAPGDVPDGIAFGKSGNLFVAIATPFASGIAILGPNGTELTRLTNPLGSPIFPYDSPANIAFDKQGAIKVTNHAFVTGAANPAQFTILDVFVNDKESPLAKPLLP